MLPKAKIHADATGIIYENSRFLESDSFLAVWDGLIYSSNGQMDEATVRSALSEIADGRDVAEVTKGLRGSFFLVICDKQNGRSYACVDDSGLYSAYRGENAVASSFLQLRDLESPDGEFDRHAAVEFLQLGCVYFGDTLSPGIKKIGADELVVVDSAGVETKPRRVSQIDDPPIYQDLFTATAALADAVKNKSIAVDLTGGFDSRLLACLLLHHGVDFEASISSYEGHIDQRLGSELADVIKRPFFYYEYATDQLLDELPEVLQRTDGLCGTVGTCHRLLKLSENRHGRGVEISLKGQAGELYKDFFWTQDFPFYRRRSSQLQRLHRLRLEFELLPNDVLTRDAYETFLETRQQRLKRLEAYTLPLNTQTYDNIYFRERGQTWNARENTTCQARDLLIHSPLSEVEAVKLGFVAPRSERFYNRLHRKYITKVSPEAARLPTTDGTSASSEWLRMAIDASGYTATKLRKLLKKISQVAFNTTRFAPAVFDVNAGATDLITNSEIGQSALAALKAHRLVDESVSYEQISPRFRENFVVLGWVLSRQRPAP